VFTFIFAKTKPKMYQQNLSLKISGEKDQKVPSVLDTCIQCPSNNDETGLRRNIFFSKRKVYVLEQGYISVQREYSMSSLVTSNVRRISNEYWSSWPRRYLWPIESCKQGLFLFEKKIKQRFPFKYFSVLSWHEYTIRHA